MFSLMPALGEQWSSAARRMSGHKYLLTSEKSRGALKIKVDNQKNNHSLYMMKTTTGLFYRGITLSQL